MRATLRVESLKLRRSRVTLVATILMALLLPAMGLGFYSVAINGGVGTVADKAAAFLVGEGWVAYLGVVDQIAAVALFLGTGIVVAWAFGREHADRTFPSLFALPVGLASMAAAKFVALAVWLVVLAVVVVVVALSFGLAGGVGPVEWSVIIPELARLLAISLATGILALTMGFVASVGRGYLAAIGAMSVIVAVTQVAVLFGTGGWFPFAVPGLLAVAGAEGVPPLNPTQIALVGAVAMAGVWATMRWWRNAEVA